MGLHIVSYRCVLGWGCCGSALSSEWVQSSHLQSALLEVQHDEVHNPSHYLVPLGSCDFHSRGTRGTVPVGTPLGPSRQRRAAKPGCAAESQDMGEITPMRGGVGEKVTFRTILATEGPSKEARLGFPIWQRKGGEEKVAQAKKG